MIEKMYKAYVVSKLADKRKMLVDLRNLGLLHIKTESTNAVSSAELDKLRAKLNQLEQVRMLLSENVDKKNPPKCADLLCAKDFEKLNSDLLQTISKQKDLNESLSRNKMKLDQIAPWGDYDSSLYKEICQSGYPMYFFTVQKKDLAKASGDFDYVLLKTVSGQTAIATRQKTLPASLSGNEFVLDNTCPPALRSQIAKEEEDLVKCQNFIKESLVYLNSYKHEIHLTSEAIKFEMANCSAKEGENLTYLVGFIPQSGLEAFKKAAIEGKYAYLIDEVVAEDEPPTKVIYNKVTGLAKPVFDILGTIPGYYEYDIGMWFLVFFSLFFAMIIGDAAYGLIFVIVAVLLHKKMKKANNLVLLVYVLGAATVIWGAVTGTWFGSKVVLEKLSFLKLFVIPQISNYPELFGLQSKTAQDMVMQFCFIIGTLQLSLACVMNIVKKAGAKDLSSVADFGWLVMIDAIYFLVLMLVLNQSVNAMAIASVVGVGFVLVVCFGSQGPGIKFTKGLAAGAADLFTTFLNTISAFGNIMSYIRLFAVGMASLAIAQSFNDMASPMLSGMAMPAGVLVLVIGHSLNLVMGLLSVVVHGVRLNLLEFSGQLGMTWTGIAYEPFCNTKETK